MSDPIDTTPLVLCVDDDLEMLTTIERILGREPYRVVAVETPLEALAILSARPVAVLVSDFEMPEMTGVELAARAREIQPETVRMLLTGHHSISTAVDGINVGEVFRFITKPFTPDRLRTEIRAALAQHRQIAAVSLERLTVVRRRRLHDALESDHPGITKVQRDQTGAYLLDADAAQRIQSPSLTPILALLKREPNR